MSTDPTPNPDPRGKKFIAGNSPAVIDWLRDQLGITHPEDVSEVVVTLRVAEAATAEVTLFLRDGALARLPEVSVTHWHPNPDQLAAAAYALKQRLPVSQVLTPAELEAVVGDVLRAAAPGPKPVDPTGSA